MVAQYFTDVSFLRTFFQTDVSIVMCLPGPFVVPINEVQMKPRLMMAALITGAQTEGLSRNGKGTMFANPPESLRARGLRKPQTSAQLFGMDPGHTMVWGPAA